MFRSAMMNIGLESRDCTLRRLATLAARSDFGKFAIYSKSISATSNRKKNSAAFLTRPIPRRQGFFSQDLWFSMLHTNTNTYFLVSVLCGKSILIRSEPSLPISTNIFPMQTQVFTFTFGVGMKCTGKFDGKHHLLMERPCEPWLCTRRGFYKAKSFLLGITWFEV